MPASNAGTRASLTASACSCLHSVQGWGGQHGTVIGDDAILHAMLLNMLKMAMFLS